MAGMKGKSGGCATRELIESVNLLRKRLTEIENAKERFANVIRTGKIREFLCEEEREKVIQYYNDIIDRNVEEAIMQVYYLTRSEGK